MSAESEAAGQQARTPSPKERVFLLFYRLLPLMMSWATLFGVGS